MFSTPCIVQQGLEHMSSLFCSLYFPSPNAWNFWLPSNPRGVQILHFAICDRVCMVWSGLRAEKPRCLDLQKRTRRETCRLQYLDFIWVGHKEQFSHGDLWIWNHLINTILLLLILSSWTFSMQPKTVMPDNCRTENCDTLNRPGLSWSEFCCTHWLSPVLENYCLHLQSAYSCKIATVVL